MTMRSPLLSTVESLETCKGSIQSSSTPIEPRGEPPARIVRPTAAELIATEEEIRRIWEDGQIPSLLHLDASDDGSYEQWLCEYFDDYVRPDDWVCGSHRCHLIYQLHGGQNIIEEVLSGRSMFLSHSRFISSAIVAGTCSIAAGLAMAVQERKAPQMVHCFLGDAASEHGHALEAIGFASASALPLHFVLTDNDSSCGVSKKQRRGSEWEWEWPSCVTKISYTPKWPHAGSLVRPKLKWIEKCQKLP